MRTGFLRAFRPGPSGVAVIASAGVHAMVVAGMLTLGVPQQIERPEPVPVMLSASISQTSVMPDHPVRTGVTPPVPAVENRQNNSPQQQPSRKTGKPRRTVAPSAAPAPMTVFAESGPEQEAAPVDGLVRELLEAAKTRRTAQRENPVPPPPEVLPVPPLPPPDQSASPGLEDYPLHIREAISTTGALVVSSLQKDLNHRRRRLFNEYFNRIHENGIHHHFAHGFIDILAELPPEHPLNSPHLRTFIDFEILTDGTVGEVRVTRSSGNPVFDAGAMAAIYDSAPFPEPPRSILSWNRRVYVNWGFYRDQRHCGVFNAEPYILERPPRTRIVRSTGGAFFQ